MPAVYLVHHPDDSVFVRESLLAPLAPLGFDRALTGPPSAIGNTAAVLVVVSEKAADSAEFRNAAEAALRSRTPVIVVYRSLPESTAPVLRDLGTAAAIAPATARRRHELWRRLARLLPPPASAPDGDPDGAGEPLAWNEQAFTVLLTDAAKRNDFAFGAALVAVFTDHLPRRAESLPDPAYPADHANADLAALRGARLFPLMREYAAAAIGSGTTDFTVRRQYGQALIELKDFAAAIDVLGALAVATPRGHKENHEARGLLGRAHKQRYVDAGAGADPRSLMTAIAEYWTVFAEDEGKVWQGINTASCLLRAARDGVPAPETDPELDLPEVIARRVLDVLDARQAEAGHRDVWDDATRVEAHVALGEFTAASTTLTDYLTHPDMQPFEVSSTYRQFDEVLQLRETAEGAQLLERLLECATRLRAGGRIGTAGATAKRFLVRVADPTWDPAGVPDLVLGTRLGTVVSIAGSEHTIEALLKDPLVISIEESRPAASPDGAALPDGVGPLEFVQVLEEYEDDGGAFTERGARALVAVVDDGIDVLHEAFLDAEGVSRIVRVWDQTDPDEDGEVPYGRLHTDEDLARYVQDGEVPEWLRRGGTHGTHVASIAVGRRCGAFAGGVAPEAKLLVVISRGVEPTGYSEAHLAALEFIDTTASALRLPVVVNVSQGKNAGAHDGQSALEVGFDEFAKGGRKSGRVVVKSAGNERGKRGHAKLTVPPGGADELVWRCPPGLSRTVNLELWWKPENDYRFQLRSPGGESSEWVDREQQEVEDFFRGQGDYRIELVPSHVDNGDKLLRVQFTCGNAPRGASAPPGEWTLAIEAVHVRVAGDVHAWIERDSGPPTEFVTHETEEMTISVPGTARSVITVGAVDAKRPVRVGSFSSFGPTRDGTERPDVCAPGVGIEAALRDSGDGVVAMDGTSMAAPHVAGAVALLLSRAVGKGAPPPTATQIRVLLRRNTMCDNAYWDRGQGYGVLDVKKLLEAGLPTLT